MDAALGPVGPDGMTGTDMGLVGGTTRVAKRVMYTVGESVRQICSSVTHPRFVFTDTAFELRSFCMAWIVVYVISPSIGRIVGFSKLWTSLLIEVTAMGGGWRRTN